MFRALAFLSDEGPTLKTLDFSVLAVHQPFRISICISTLPTQHTTFIYIRMITYGRSLDLVTFLYSISRLQGSMIALQSKEAFLCRHQSCLNCFTSNNDAAKIICTLRKNTPNRNTKMFIAKKTPYYLKVISIKYHINICCQSRFLTVNHSSVVNLWTAI